MKSLNNAHFFRVSQHGLGLDTGEQTSVSGVTQTDRQTEQTGQGSVVKVEGKRMKERFFLLVLGRLKTSADTCATYTHSQRSGILNAQRM